MNNIYAEVFCELASLHCLSSANDQYEEVVETSPKTVM